jgi:hypothetical protein
MIGSSVAGISISYSIPGDAFGPFRTQQVLVNWDCSYCPNNYITVLPHPASGLIQALDWPDLVQVLGIGMISTGCPLGVPTQETTWGSVKSLYK